MEFPVSNYETLSLGFSPLNVFYFNQFVDAYRKDVLAVTLLFPQHLRNHE